MPPKFKKKHPRFKQSDPKQLFTVDLQLNFTLVSLSITNFHSLNSSNSS